MKPRNRAAAFSWVSSISTSFEIVFSSGCGEFPTVSVYDIWLVGKTKKIEVKQGRYYVSCPCLIVRLGFYSEINIVV